MRPLHVKEALRLHIKMRTPVFIWGPPGIGKSNVVAQLAKEMKYTLIDIRALLLDPVDLRGVPAIDIKKKQTFWCPPCFLPTDDKYYIIFLDELNAAAPAVQAACYQLIQDRKLGEYTLPKNTVVLAAGNREIDRAVTHRMPTPLANKFAHIDFDLNNDDWIDWALDNDIPTDDISFIKFRPELLNAFDPSKPVNNKVKCAKAFPTPRTWEKTFRMMLENPSQEIEYEMVTGFVGEGAATEYMSFKKICRQLPNPDLIIHNPMGAKIPTDPATLYATCGALAFRATENTIGPIVKYANRMKQQEFSVLLIRDAVKKCPDIVSTRPFIDWSAKHKDVLI